MKGIELPINALIIITVAVLVLLGIVALWMSGWGGGSQGITLEAAKTIGCAALLRDSAGCTSVDPGLIMFDGVSAFRHVVRFDADGNGTPGELTDTLQQLCNRYYGTATAGDCRKVCGCGA
jgi:hypothetical protein